jgi:STE24 endopeptidase
MVIKNFCLAILISITTCNKASSLPDTISAPHTVTENTKIFDPVEAAQKYLDTLTPKEKERSDAYFEGGYWLMLWNLIAEIIVAFIFLSLGLSQWIKKIAYNAKNANIQNLIYIGFYFLLSYILTFPINLYQNYFREHQYNLSNMNFGGWFGEEMIGLGLIICFGSLLLMLVYLVIRKVKKNWWIWGCGLVVLFLIIGMFIFPVFISPLFNSYKPLAEGKLKNDILSMARSNGIPAKDVYQFDASKQSSKISANVSGFGSTIRISLNDNLVNNCNSSEIKAVMGHEMGHYVMNHIYKTLVMIGVLIFLGFFLVNWLFHKVLQSWGAAWKIKDLSDIGGLPLLILLFTFLVFFSTPITNNITRTMEIESDYFGLNIAREPDGFASVSMKLSAYRKINPGYWEEIIFFDHPSGKTRVLTAMKWKAENLEIP